MIRATRGSRILDYRIYLGENNTTDFNVGRNTSHTLDITISGDNEVDTRVHGYTLSVTDDFESNRIGDYCVLPFNASLYVNIERAEREPTLTGELELLTPTDGTFLVDYEECDPRYDLSLYYQQGSNYYELVYYPRSSPKLAHGSLMKCACVTATAMKAAAVSSIRLPIRFRSYSPTAVQSRLQGHCPRKIRMTGRCVPPATNRVAPHGDSRRGLSFRGMVR